jgi:hypothetical protein
MTATAGGRGRRRTRHGTRTLQHLNPLQLAGLAARVDSCGSEHELFQDVSHIHFLPTLSPQDTAINRKDLSRVLGVTDRKCHVSAQVDKNCDEHIFLPLQATIMT